MHLERQWQEANSARYLPSTHPVQIALFLSHLKMAYFLQETDRCLRGLFVGSGGKASTEFNFCLHHLLT